MPIFISGSPVAFRRLGGGESNEALADGGRLAGAQVRALQEEVKALRRAEGMTALGAGVVYLSGYAAKAASRCESRRTDRPITAAVLGSWSAGHDRRGRQLQDLFAVQAALLATIAFPIRLDGDWITVAWTAEAVALAIAGARLPALWMRVFSVGLFGVVLLMAPQALLGQDEQLLFINLRFLTLAGAAIGLAVAGFAVRRLVEKPLPMERTGWAIGLGIANIVALIAVSLEAWDFVQGLSLDLDLDLAAQVVLSASWLVWAAAPTRRRRQDVPRRPVVPGPGLPDPLLPDCRRAAGGRFLPVPASSAG